MAIYNNAFLYFDGQLLTENATINTRLERRTEDVFSITGNYEGQDVGPMVRVIEIEEFVPLKGTEYPFEEKMATDAKVIATFQEGTTGHEVTSIGQITHVDRSGGVGQHMKVRCTFRGDASPVA